MITQENKRRIDHCEFVEQGSYYSHRFCRLISGLCRYMSISALAKHFDLRWETIKNMDKHYLQETLPALNPGELFHLRYIGVDEVARAKGHDYMTVVYNLQTGQLIWVYEGRTAQVFSLFLKQLPEATNYILKEQLQALWKNKTYETMENALETWCHMADQTEMVYIKKIAELLRRYKTGICNYAKHPLTTARIEAGNVGIGMIRKRARGIRDTEYFKLKIRQLSTPEEISMFYQKAA